MKGAVALHLLIVFVLANCAGEPAADLLLSGDSGCVAGLNPARPNKRTCFQIVGEDAIVDADINLGPLNLVRKASHRSLITLYHGSRWPGGRVTYVFADPNLGTSNHALKSRFEAAVARYNAIQSDGVSVIQFTEGELRPRLESHITVKQAGPDTEPGGKHCKLPAGVGGTATVGRQYGVVCLAANASESVVLHELGHVLGFWHEHQREDRDKFVNVSVRPPSAAECYEYSVNAGIETRSRQDVGVYDFASIMSYNVTGFSIPNCTTPLNLYDTAFVHLQPRSPLPAGQYSGQFRDGSKSLSAKDIENIVAIYGGSFLDAPDSLAIVQLAPTSARLSLVDNAIHGSTVVLEYATGTNNDWVTVDAARGLRVENLTPNTRYRFRAYAYNDLGTTPLRSAYSSEVVGTTPSVRRTFQLGGNISGVMGPVTLTLEVNSSTAPYDFATQTLTVDRDGAFTFPVRVEEGAPYTISFTRVEPAYRVCSFSPATLQPMPSSDSNALSISCRNNSYSVGGTTSGLSTYFLVENAVLLTNGTEDLRVFGNQSYQFATRFEYGSSVQVSVKTPPRGLRCVVDNGTFTVGMQNDQVNVICAPPSYTVGGSVSGLVGQITLRGPGSAGNEQITMNADGPFSFLGRLNDSATYRVSIQTQPAGQSCGINSGYGQIWGANVTAQVICTSLNYPVRIQVNGVSSSLVGFLVNGAPPVISTGFRFFLPFGTPYTVEVASAPTGKNCVVENPTGTIGTVNSPVNVTCTTASYTVGGTVSGLDGEVELLGPGFRQLAINANGPFTFPSRINHLVGYSVSIAKQPSGQDCTVANANGQVSGANATSVQVTCVTPTYPVRVVVAGLRSNESVGLMVNETMPMSLDSSRVQTEFSLPMGTPYNITMSSSPDRKRCVMENSRGTISTSNSPINVVCFAR